MLLLVINYHKSVSSTTSFAKEQILCLHYNFVINNEFRNVFLFFFLLQTISADTHQIVPDESSGHRKFDSISDQQMETFVFYNCLFVVFSFSIYICQCNK